jgi:processive 1,2-diacylglycerol beta-glucosyltransferase
VGKVKRILILHISQCGGHKKASENLEEALKSQAPFLEILNLDGLDYINPYVEKIVDSLYTLVINYIPSLWGKIYDKKKVIKCLTPFKKFVSRCGFSKLSLLIDEFKPDIILATQAFPCGLVADFKESYKFNTPLIGVVTDYYPHRFWLHPQVDVYTVASYEAKSVLEEEGIDSNRVKVLGIPISVKFLNSKDRESIAEEFGFHPNLDTVMIMGGGLGLGPMERIATILDRLDERFQLVVVCGQNKKLYLWFKKKAHHFKRPLFYFGYVDFIGRLMDFSDILITKGGGLTVSEALAKGLATIVFRPIPGQEERNTSFLLKKGLILKAQTIAQIPQLVKYLLKNKSELLLLKEKTKEQVIVDSSLRIANLVLSYIQ